MRSEVSLICNDFIIVVWGVLKYLLWFFFKPQTNKHTLQKRTLTDPGLCSQLCRIGSDILTHSCRFCRGALSKLNLGKFAALETA